MKNSDEFKEAWAKNNKEFGIDEPFPEGVVEIARMIKFFMQDDFKRYQGATGNAKGMLDAVKSYVNECKIENTEKLLKNVEIIIDYILTIRLTSQVPLNTAYFMKQKIEHVDVSKTSAEEMKKIILAECKKHETNYREARKMISEYMAARIIDRCDDYGVPSITVGTHCHSGAVVDAIIKSKKYIKRVIVSKTEPEQQGILTANSLLEAGINVKLINLEQYGTEHRNVNMFLFGIDAVSVEGTVLNKAGTRMIATMAKAKEIPVYFLGETYKYARDTLMGGLIRIERRDVTKQLLHNHLGVNLEKYVESGQLNTEYMAFDTTKPELYNSIVSERGFLPMREAFREQWKDYID